MKRERRVIPGVNIQWPWSQLLLSGQKTVETRGYPIPEKYLGVELAIIETPGPRGKKEGGVDKARIVGTITFCESFQYRTKSQWEKDVARHMVDITDPQFAWGKSKERWGWRVTSVKLFNRFYRPPVKRGIVFATACEIPKGRLT